MSGDGSVKISITGSVDQSLAAATGQASAELDKLRAAGAGLGGQPVVAAKDFAAALRAAGNDVRKISADTLEMGKVAQTALGGAKDSAEAAAGGTRQLSFGTSGAIQEYVRLGHEAMQGNFSRIPGTLVVLASRMGGLESAAASVSAAFAGIGWTTLGVAAAVAAAGAAMAYFAAQEVVAAEAAEHLKLAADFSGNFGVSSDAIDKLTRQLDQLPNITKDDAGQTAQAILSLKDVTEEEFVGMTAAVAAYSSAANVDMSTAKEAIVHAFADPIAHAKEFIESLHTVSPALTEQVNRSVAAQDASGTLSLMLQALGEKYRGMVPAIADANTGIFQSWTQFGLFMNALLRGESVELNQQYILQVLAGRYGALADQIGRAAAAEAARTKVPTISSASVTRGLEEIAETTRKTDAEILREQIAFLQKQLDLAGTSAALREEIERDLAHKRVELERKTSTDIIGETRAAAAAGGIFGEARVRAEIAADKELLANTAITANDRIAVERDLNTKLSELNQAQASAGTAAARAAAQAERSAAAEAERERKRLAEEAIRDAQAVAAAHIKAANDASQSELRSIEQRFKYENLTAEEEIALARAVEAARDASVNASLAVALKAAGDNREAVRQINKQIEEEFSEHTKRLADINRRGLDEQVQQWSNLNNRIFSAEDELVAGVFSGQQTMWQLLRSTGLHFLQQMIADDLKYWTERRLLAREGVAAQNASERGGFSELVRLLTGKTAATAASESTKTAIVVAGQANQTGAVVAAETAQVGAVAAGETAKLTIKKTADALGLASSAATGSSLIVNDAYKAAAGAYAALVDIPIIGPIIAPIAAAATFTAVMAFDVLTGAEGGQERVRGAQQFTVLHQDEMVLPAHIADPLRNVIAAMGSMSPVNFSGGLGGRNLAGRMSMDSGGSGSGSGGLAIRGSSGGGRGGDHFHIHAMDAGSFKDFLRKTANRRAVSEFARDRARAGA